MSEGPLGLVDCDEPCSNTYFACIIVNGMESTMLLWAHSWCTSCFHDILFFITALLTCVTNQVVVRVRPMNDRELFTSDPTAVQVDEQDPQQMQVSSSLLRSHPPPPPQPQVYPYSNSVVPLFYPPPCCTGSSLKRLSKVASNVHQEVWPSLRVTCSPHVGYACTASHAS